MSPNQDGTFLHRLLSIRTYENMYRMPRRKPVPGHSNGNNDTEGNTSLDRPDGDTISAISPGDSHIRRSSADNEDLLSARSESTRDDDQDHLESAQRTPTGSVDLHDHEVLSSQASAHSVHDLGGLGTSSPDAEPSTDQHQAWLPFYLRKGVFITFVIVLGIMAVALEVLFFISKKHQGLTESYARLHYLWTYGPTALLTLIQAFWGRVDYEAKVTAPWLRANPICASRDAILLDYVDMFPLAVPFRAFKNRDYPVAAGATISLLFTMLIVLSTGLITLSPVELVGVPVPISLKTQFMDSPARLNNTSPLPLETLKAGSAHYPYPDGMSDQFAFQSFSSNLPGVSETRATVDGIYMGLDCAEATVKGIRLTLVNSVLGEPWNINYAEGNFSMYLENRDCNSTLLFDADDSFEDGAESLYPERYLIMARMQGLTPGHCESTSSDHDRLVVISAEPQFKLINETRTTYDDGSYYDINYEFEATGVQSTALVCVPDYGITSVDVVRNATGVKSVTRHGDDPPRRFSDIHSWDILQAYLYGVVGLDFIDLSLSTDPILPLGNITTNFSAWNFLYSLPDDLLHQFSLFLNATSLERLVIVFHQRFASIFLAQSLTDQIDIPSTAAGSRTVDRLLVQAASSQWMVGVMVLMIIILVALSLTRPKKLPSRMEPGSMLVTAALAGHLTASRFPRDIGAVDTKALETRMAKLNDNTPAEQPPPSVNETEGRQEADNQVSSTETPKPDPPLVLRPIFRVIMYVLIASCVAILEVLLQRSDRYQGLGDVQDDTYLHYVWTVLPATIVSIYSLYLSSVDSQTRLLAPYHSFIRVASIGSSLEADLLRPLMPVALYRQIRARSLSTLASSVAALVASMFAIGVASLYQLRTLPEFTSVDVRTTSTFTTNCDESGITNITKRSCTYLYSNLWSNATSPLGPSTLASLVLEGNLSYTPLVYENLIFPGIALDHSATNTSQVSADTVISLTLPALRPQLSCHWYPESDIISSFFYNQTVTMDFVRSIISDGVAINITGEECAVNAISSSFPAPGSTATFTTSLPAEALFAAATDPTGTGDFGCSNFLFIWGSFSSLTNPPGISTTALACNGTTETVDVVVSLIGPQLQFDPSRPPQPIESTSRAYSMYIPNAYGTYGGLSPLPLHRNDTLFDSFFEALVTSRYAIPISSIADPSQANAVKDAIVFQHGVTVAQSISRFYRVSTEVPSDRINGSIFPSLSNLTPATDTGAYSATASDPHGRRRLVQDPASTRVVQALLLAALVLSLAGWGLGPGNAVLPRSPTSVASVLALLAGGDVLEFMYKDGGGDWKTAEGAKAVFPSGCKFWMGWGPPGTSTEEKDRRFGIWMVPF